MQIDSEVTVIRESSHHGQDTYGDDYQEKVQLLAQMTGYARTFQCVTQRSLLVYRYRYVVNVRSQLIHSGIFIIISLSIQCDASNTCGPGKVLDFAQNPLQTFSRNFPVDGEVANLLRTC